MWACRRLFNIESPFLFRLNLLMSPRDLLRPAQYCRGFIGLTALAFVSLCLGCWRSASLPPGLPGGLAEKHGQLTRVLLPPSVDRLDWVPQHFEALSAAGTQIQSLQGLPNSLRELDVSRTELRSLEGLPRGLRVLDIQRTGIEHLVGLPPKLETLKVQNHQISRLGKLPSTLRVLHLANTDVSDLTGLPSSLRTLHLEGPSIKNLDGLPGTLLSLTLTGTSVSDLKSLPPSLQELNLFNNSRLQFTSEDLPPLLTRMILDNRSWTTLRNPRYLTSLTFRASDWRESDWPQLAELPRNLRLLGLLNAFGPPLEDLPPELEILDLTGYRRPQIASLRYLKNLKRLEIDFSDVVQMPDLPVHIESLNLGGSKIRTLPTLPTGLTELSFCNSSLTHLDGKKDLPSSLKKLNLCKSRSLKEISSLPEKLTHLNLEGTSIDRLPMLGGSLRELDVSSTKIKRLDLLSLPRQLETLIVSEGQIDDLRDLPAGVRTLQIVRAETSELHQP